MELAQAKPLTYGVLRKNKEIVDGLTTPGMDIDQRIAASIAFLKLAYPDATDEDFDGFTPGAILAGAADVYKATFARPEDAAPVPQNP